jgi:hypothetical protein
LFLEKGGKVGNEVFYLATRPHKPSSLPKHLSLHPCLRLNCTTFEKGGGGHSDIILVHVGWDNYFVVIFPNIAIFSEQKIPN